MANFEIRIQGVPYRVSAQNLAIRVAQTKDLWLYGGDVSGQPLTVASSDTAIGVTEISDKTPQPNYRHFQLKATQDADTVRISATPGGAGTPWDYVDYTVLTRTESAEFYSARVMSIAADNVGQHYVWGAAGARPDQRDGMPGRPGSVTLLNQEWDPRAGSFRREVQHGVAVCQVVGYNTCAGKAAVNPSLTPDRLDSVQEDLTRSLRTVFKEYSRGSNRRLGVALGERCENKRHFDCVGFVNYCFSMALEESVQNDICGSAESGYRAWANSYPSVRDDRAGDILIFGGQEIDFTDSRSGQTRRVLSGAHHIGLATGNGKMIHAKETEYGVVGPEDVSNITRRVRHPRLTNP